MQNNVSIKVEKRLCITFEKKKYRTKSLKLKLGQQQLTKTECVKHLGVYISKNSWTSKNIRIITNWINKFCGTFYQLRKNLRSNHLFKTYKSEVPVVQYGLLLHGCATSAVIEPLEICQRKLIRIVFWKKGNDAIHKVCEENKILSIRDLDRYEVMKLGSKILRRETVSDTINGFISENEVEALRQKRLSARGLPVLQPSLDSSLKF